MLDAGVFVGAYVGTRRSDADEPSGEVPTRGEISTDDQLGLQAAAHEVMDVGADRATGELVERHQVGHVEAKQPHPL